jgi:hypothetical protein
MKSVALPYHLYVWVDNKHLGGETGTTRAVLHGVCARLGQVILGHVLLETGAHWTGVPIHGIFCKENVSTEFDLKSIQPWGAMGEEINVCHLPYLEGLRIEIFNKKWLGRSTGIIIDWNDGFSRHPEQHKPLHLLQMDTGHYSLQPNNYIRWSDPSFVEVEKWIETKNYRRGDKIWWPEDE